GSPQHGRPLSLGFPPRRCPFGPIPSLSNVWPLCLHYHQRWQRLKPPCFSSQDISQYRSEDLPSSVDKDHTRWPKTPERQFCRHGSIIVPARRSAAGPFQYPVLSFHLLTTHRLPNVPELSVRPAQN